MGALLVLVRRLLIAAWRYRWGAVAVAWLVCGIGWVGVYTIPNQYEASARLYVDADAVLTPLLRGLSIDSSLSSQLDVLQRTLLSRPNLEKLVSNTDLDLAITGPSDLEALVLRLGTDIKITPQTRNLFTISYRNTTPKLAFDVVQTILTTFIESKTGNNRSEMENAQLFLQQQIAQYETQLRAAERKRADFRAKYLDLLPMGDNGGNRLDQAQATLRQLQGQLADEVAKRELLNRELTSTPQLIVTETEAAAPGVAAAGTPAAAAAAALKDARVEAAQNELNDLRLRYTENHPDVVAARHRLEALTAQAQTQAAAAAKAAEDASAARAAAAAAAAKAADSDASKAAAAAAAAARASKSLPNPIYEQVKVRLYETESTIASLQRQIADATRERDRLEEMARSAPGVQAEFINLNRDYDVLRKNYDELLGRREQMRIATSAEADADKIKIQVIDPPQVPQNPVAPKRTLLVSAVLAAGLAAGIAIAVLLVQFDQSFHTIDELRDLGLPVAGGISLLNVTVTRGRFLSVMMFGMALLALGAIYGGLVYRLAHTPGAL
jgi:polysaccharide chain length determinant protein (PEP-CTERM system associated)